MSEVVDMNRWIAERGLSDELDRADRARDLVDGEGPNVLIVAAVVAAVEVTALVVAVWWWSR